MVVEDGLIVPRDPWLRKYYWDLKKVARHCCRCSACKWVPSWEIKSARFARVCPSISYRLFDAFSCQGRMDVALGLLEGRLNYDDSPPLLEIMYLCQMDGGCDVQCKAGKDMEPLRVMQEIRAALVQRGQLLPQHVPVIESLRREDNMMMGKKADRGRWAEGLDLKDLTTERAQVVFHAGCRSCFDPETWGTVREAVRILKSAGVDVGIMGRDETCCGCRAYSMGYRSEFVKYAENNIQAWSNAGVRTVVVACADCYYGIKRLYGDIGSTFRVLHIVEYLGDLLQTGKLRFRKPVRMKVTYHDPCHIGRLLPPYAPGQPVAGMHELPRSIIRAVPGVTLLEMDRIREFAWCCGAGGGVAEAYPDFHLWTAAQRIEEARATGAEALVTACPWCEWSFRNAARETGGKLPVYDIVELVQQAF